MRSYNRVMLVGHLAANPELRCTKKGKNVANFPIAINRSSVDLDGNKHEIADFHRVVAWERLGDICDKYLVKGMPILVEGRLVNSMFNTEEGKKQYRTEIVAESLQVLNWKKSKSGEEGLSIDPMPGSDEIELVAT